jgi:hypothetical protein
MLGRSNGFDQSLQALAALPAAGPWFGRVLKRQIIVHQKSGDSIEGVLMEQTTDGIILRAANLLRDGGEKTSMAGEVFVPRENVAFAQLDE